jgi:hypothetical protein
VVPECGHDSKDEQEGGEGVVPECGHDSKDEQEGVTGRGT